MIIATDKQMAKELDISPRTLVEWKKHRVRLYERLVWSYKVEERLKAIDEKASDIQFIAKELLQK